MVSVFIRAGVLPSSRKLGKGKLRVQGALTGTLIPRKGDWLRAAVPYLASKGVKTHRTHRFLITEAVACWEEGGEHWEFSAEATFEDLVHLALVHEWQVIGGFDELSPDQRSLVECRQGLCSHAGHDRPAA